MVERKLPQSFQVEVFVDSDGVRQLHKVSMYEQDERVLYNLYPLERGLLFNLPERIRLFDPLKDEEPVGIEYEYCRGDVLGDTIFHKGKTLGRLSANYARC